ncbi:hypothetical protein LIER_07869 [Lithospermum erythrorhizon]|uniref:Uncharacterized protein n=1 Tax=Lithospermum erythrorhizon TaxID=34254 RepID=A0AAV3P9V0_LITER
MANQESNDGVGVHSKSPTAYLDQEGDQSPRVKGSSRSCWVTTDLCSWARVCKSHSHASSSAASCSNTSAFWISHYFFEDSTVEETIRRASLHEALEVLPWEGAADAVSASLLVGRSPVACHEDRGSLPNPSM